MRSFLILLLLTGFSGLLRAQSPTGPPENVAMHVGPLFVNPTISLNNAGTDTNVFNESTNPKRDFTVTVTPGTDLWLRFGRSWITTSIKEELVWFNKYASERSANNLYAAAWVIPLSRFTFTPRWAYVNTRQRPGFEIDTRAQRTETTYGGVAEIRVLSKTFFGFTGQQQVTNFDGSAEFLGINLRNELNRKVTSGGLLVRHDLTPLTSVSLNVSKEQTRFDFDHLRDSDSTSIDGAIRFDPAALIKGSATFGYRDFKPLSSSVPGYRGSTAQVDLSYVLLGVTKLGGQVVRNIQYSYDVNQPYYVLTGVTGSVTQQIFGPVDIVVRGGLQRLEYRDRAGAVVAISDRVDHVQTLGGGVGYRLGHATRIGFNVDQSRRISGVEARRFEGLTYGFAVTYGS